MNSYPQQMNAYPQQTYQNSQTNNFPHQSYQTFSHTDSYANDEDEEEAGKKSVRCYLCKALNIGSRNAKTERTCEKCSKNVCKSHMKSICEHCFENINKDN